MDRGAALNNGQADQYLQLQNFKEKHGIDKPLNDSLFNQTTPYVPTPPTVNPADFCKFPSEVIGKWLFPDIGILTFTVSLLQGLHPCRSTNSCLRAVPDEWHCHKESKGSFLLITQPWLDASVAGSAMMCLHLIRRSPSVYLYYFAKASFPYRPFHDFAEPMEYGQFPVSSDYCKFNLDTIEGRKRVGVMIRKDAKVEDYKANDEYCSQALNKGQLMLRSGDCLVHANGCNGLIVYHKEPKCMPDVFFSDSGKLKCLQAVTVEGVDMILLVKLESTFPENVICLALQQDRYDSGFFQAMGGCEDVMIPGQTGIDRTAQHFYLVHRLDFACQDRDPIPLPKPRFMGDFKFSDHFP